ncbi:hypothetical protein BDV97DRAFT_90426 [Delphinella strobiligena]|nr:hypothetical protein BDV97DRAFT_90426 [Delphinella strobiligena]
MQLDEAYSQTQILNNLGNMHVTSLIWRDNSLTCMHTAQSQQTCMQYGPSSSLPASQLSSFPSAFKAVHGSILPFSGESKANRKLRLHGQKPVGVLKLGNAGQLNRYTFAARGKRCARSETCVFLPAVHCRKCSTFSTKLFLDLESQKEQGHLGAWRLASIRMFSLQGLSKIHRYWMLGLIKRRKSIVAVVLMEPT